MEEPVVTLLDNGKLLKYQVLRNGKTEPFFKIKKTCEFGKVDFGEPAEDLTATELRKRGVFCTQAEFDKYQTEEYTKTLTNGAWIYLTDTGDIYMWDSLNNQWHLQ